MSGGEQHLRRMNGGFSTAPPQVGLLSTSPADNSPNCTRQVPLCEFPSQVLSANIANGTSADLLNASMRHDGSLENEPQRN